MTSESPSAGPTNSGGAAATPAGQPPFDVSVAHVARVYDYWLGGTDNFPADRAAGDQAIAAYPDIVLSVRANRAFLARAVGYLVTEAGIRQFLDIGTGIPPRTTPTRSPRPRRPIPGSSTWTRTRSCSPTPGPC